MAEITIWHNPNCSTSRFAVEAAEEAGVEVDLRKYLLVAQRPSRDEIVGSARRASRTRPPTWCGATPSSRSTDSTDADVQTAEQVADVLAEHPELLQRPVLVKGGRAIIGRPKDRVAPFLVG